ncbi:DNA fragmentation factor subunit beta isoform X3 [Sturnira hondurensis]|uniref:DNA fragmentation factor subunit beta isoform X3 n=1 Tax=Sturnira hondurensis TaxID=192404 RepID=UPI00187A5D61|nr:DNA fragmentation factor subunit beta isoform X3 [Sturnira hondurensis]
MMSVFRKPKTFKLRALHSPQKFGVAGKSCQEVVRKGCLHFQLPVPGSRLCLYEDGTEVTGGYFWSIPDNSELVLLTEGQTWDGCLESRFRSKSSYLRFSCEGRIRGYLREVNAHTPAVGAQTREEFARVVDAMGQKLRAAQYNGCYFDRGAKAGSRLCTPEGWFSCQGPFDMASCASRHSINPYSNRESRVLFSTWNLDHVIEKKRTVIPTLAGALEDQDGRQLDWEYFYSLLFTSENLKLVHVACHKKTTHGLSCDPSRIYRPRTKPRRRRATRKCP